MCGIAGIIDFCGIPIQQADLRMMVQQLVHRGPDDEDIYVNQNVGLGFRRLSIIDLENGRQPMRSKSGRFILVFNGEIYNFKELRSDLSNRGYEFQTCSDTEIILALFELGYKHPETMLDGMFVVRV